MPIETYRARRRAEQEERANRLAREIGQQREFRKSIIELANQGVAQKAIAARYGISKGAVSGIVFRNRERSCASASKAQSEDNMTITRFQISTPA
jgi:hypothetical protein